MWNSNASDDKGQEGSIGEGDTLRRYCVAASVNDDLIAAVEGWRRAHGFAEQPEALGELVRLGLMSEVAKIYRQICRNEIAVSLGAESLRKSRRHHRTKRGARKEHPLPTN